MLIPFEFPGNMFNEYVLEDNEARSMCLKFERIKWEDMLAYETSGNRWC